MEFESAVAEVMTSNNATPALMDSPGPSRQALPQAPEARAADPQATKERTPTHQETNVKSKDRILQSQPSEPDDEVAERIAMDTDKAFDAGHVWFDDPNQPEAQCLQ